jgi:protein phosphatase 1 regulatory subunit 36
MKSFRHQMSPIIAELANLLSEENEEIFKIGTEKYRGTNKYLFHLELEFSIPECHFCLVGLRRGILGHPKSIYDTMLNLDGGMIHKMGWCDNYDPHGLIKRAFINIHTSDDFVERFCKQNLLIN